MTVSPTATAASSARAYAIVSAYVGSFGRIRILHAIGIVRPWCSVFTMSSTSGRSAEPHAKGASLWSNDSGTAREGCVSLSLTVG